MAFDGITTACLCREFSDRLEGARIYKIAQTDRDELVLTLKPAAERGGGQCRLYLSADASLPLAYFTSKSRQAPLQAPAFCMLLRKHLQNGRIVSVTQPGLERILRFEVEHLDEMGDLCRHTLVIELMGKHSNIIFLKSEKDARTTRLASLEAAQSASSSDTCLCPQSGHDYKCEEDAAGAGAADAGAGFAAGAAGVGAADAASVAGAATAQGSEQIVDSIKHISSLVSSVREVLPGRRYFIPDTRNKKDPMTETPENFDALLRSQQVPPARLLVNTYTGLSTQMAEELCYRAALSNDRSASSMTAEDRASLWNTFHSLMHDVRDGCFAPRIYYAAEEGGRRGAPVGYSAVPMRIYADFPDRYPEVRFHSMSELLETFYAEKNEVTRIRQKSADLRRVVQTILERDVHKYDLQLKQIRDTEKRDKYRVYGELLNAYGYTIPAGSKSCDLDNYYTGEKIRVPLDPTLTPMQNAKKYFDRYTKLKRTNEALTALTAEVKAEIDHLESIRTSLDLATNEGDLAQIRQELEDSGLVKRHGGGKKRPGFDKSGGTGGGKNNGTGSYGSGAGGGKGSGAGGGKKGRARTPVSKPLHFISSDGYDIYVGKNNTQNDALTFHFADPDDIWLHANDIPGSHVILRTGGKRMEEIPDRAFEEAASLAAWYSAGREQGKVEIDYLLRRNVKKPGGAKPGFVVYYTNYSILARADITELQEADS